MRRHWKRMTLVIGAVLLIGLLAISGCGKKEEPQQQATNSAPTTVAKGDYVGDTACKACHAEMFDAWSQTTHGNFIKDYTKEPKALLGTLEGNYPKMVNFKAEDIQYVLLGKPGKLDIQELVGKKGAFGVPADDYPVLWGSWNIAEEKWEVEVEAIGEGTPWLRTCAGCHVTGLEVPTEKNPKAAAAFVGYGITCEQCHGSGAKHIQSPRENPMTISYSADNCGQCHSRGASTAKNVEGKTFGYPYNDAQGQYTPDKNLADFYKWATPETDKEGKSFWPTKHAKSSHHMQYPEWLMSGHKTSVDTLKANPGAKDACLKCHSAAAFLGQKVTLAEANDGVTCQVCHASHSPKPGETMLRTSKKEICAQCHNAEGGLVVGKEAHHPQKEMNLGAIGLGYAVTPSVMEKAGVTCVDCHMPKTAGPRDSHLMKVVMPKDGKQYKMPDSCSSCHKGTTQDYLQGTVDKWQGDVTKKMAEVKAKLDANKANANSQQYKEASLYYSIVDSDGSKGVHNYDLSMKLLNDAAARLK